MKIYDISTKSRVIHTRSYRYLQMLVAGKWLTMSKYPAKPRTLPEGVTIVRSA